MKALANIVQLWFQLGGVQEATEQRCMEAEQCLMSSAAGQGGCTAS